MKKKVNYFVCLTLLLIVACSTEPIETGPYRTHTYKCALDGHDYEDQYSYDLFCNEEHIEFTRISDSISHILMTEKKINMYCKIDEAIIQSKLYTQSEHVSMSITFGSDFFMASISLSLDSIWTQSYFIYGESTKYTVKKYACPDFLPAGVDSVFADSTCSDTLGIQAIIDVFANFPDSLCEELPNQ